MKDLALNLFKGHKLILNADVKKVNARSRGFSPLIIFEKH